MRVSQYRTERSGEATSTIVGELGCHATRDGVRAWPRLAMIRGTPWLSVQMFTAFDVAAVAIKSRCASDGLYAASFDETSASASLAGGALFARS